MQIRSEKATPFFVFLIFYAFFLLTLARNFSAPHDAIDYLHAFETGTDLFNPHHVLYHITTYWILSFLRLIFSGTADFFLVEAIDGFWGAMILVIVFNFFRNRFGYDRITAFIATCLPAFSFGLWFYSTNIEVYMPPLFFLLLSLYYISKPVLARKDAYAIILFHVIAILFHQANILFIPIVLWKFFRNRHQIKPLPLLLVYAFGGGGIVVLTYLIIGRFVLHYQTMDGIVHWMRGYTNESTYWFPLSLSTFFNAIVGMTHAFVGAHFLFRVKFIEDYLNSRFFYHNLTDELFLVQKVSHTQAMILLILSMVLAGIIFSLLVLLIMKWRVVLAKFRSTLAPLLMFLLIYSVFFYFWMPENLEFWIPQMVVIWMFLAGSLNALKTRINKRLILSIAAILLLIVNYFGSIRWMRDFQYDLFYAKMIPVKERATKNDLVLLEDGWIIKSYLEVYTPARVSLVPVKDSIMQRIKIDSLVNATFANNGKIFIYTDKTVMHAIHNPQYVDSLLRTSHQLDSINSKAGRILILQ